MSEIFSNKRIAKNTILLYVRMFFVLFVGLFTTRIVLNTLGTEDYGIYSVVGGIVAMLSFLNAAMSGATTRFLTYELGKGNKERLVKTFSTTLIIHIFIAIIIVIVSETLGVWFLKYKLVIPESRMFAANVVLQLSILSCAISITQVPYTAIIMSHEKIDLYSYIEIINVVLKLVVVYLLMVSSADRLILYSSLMFIVSACTMLFYRIYCIKHFEECNFRWIYDSKYIKAILGYSLWSLYPNLCFTSRQQGINFLLNIYGGPLVNAASGLATTFSSIIDQFTNNILTAVRPPLIKLYAAGDLEKMYNLLKISTLSVNILYGIIAIPLISNCTFMLHLWLGNIPDYTAGFCIAMVFMSFFSLNNTCVNISIQANGNIKKYSLLSGTSAIFCLVIIGILLKMGINLYITYIMSIVNSVIIYSISLAIYCKIFKNVKILLFFNDTIIRSFYCLLPSIISVYIISNYIGNGWCKLIVTTFVSTIICIFNAITWALPVELRNKLKSTLKNKLRKNKL